MECTYYGFDFPSRFLLETKESSIKLHGNRKGSDHITCKFPVYPRSKINVLDFCHGSKLTLPTLQTVTVQEVQQGKAKKYKAD